MSGITGGMITLVVNTAGLNEGAWTISGSPATHTGSITSLPPGSRKPVFWAMPRRLFHLPVGRKPWGIHHSRITRTSIDAGERAAQK